MVASELLEEATTLDSRPVDIAKKRLDATESVAQEQNVSQRKIRAVRKLEEQLVETNDIKDLNRIASVIRNGLALSMCTSGTETRLNSKGRKAARELDLEICIREQ